MNICEHIDLGELDYAGALRLQKKYLADVIGGGNHKLIFCQHTPVITLGRMTKEEHLLLSKNDYQKRGVDIFAVDRGGDVTLHAPGQQIIYPIFDLARLDLKDLHKYIRYLEQVMLDVLERYGIQARRQESNTGIWVDRDKIISMGIGVRKWVSFHGIGLNVSTDLDLFSLIKPCGLDVQMTSIEKITKKSVEYQRLKDTIVKSFADQFSLDIRNTQHA